MENPCEGPWANRWSLVCSGALKRGIECWHPPSEPVDQELFRKTGWTMMSLVRHLKWDRRSLKRELEKAGLSIETRKCQSLNDRDVETIMTLYLKRRAERLLGNRHGRMP